MNDDDYKALVARLLTHRDADKDKIEAANAIEALMARRIVYSPDAAAMSERVKAAEARAERARVALRKARKYKCRAEAALRTFAEVKYSEGDLDQDEVGVEVQHLRHARAVLAQTEKGEHQ